MRSSFLPAALAVGLLLSSAAQAAERKPFETVKGWEVERTVGDTSENPCLMTHTYKDKDDNNAANAISFARDGSEAAIALAYQGWEWDKDEKVKLSVYFDKKAIKMKGPWLGSGTSLRTQFPATLVPDLLATKKIILKFDDGDADFDIANFAAGYESLVRCDAAPAKTAAKPEPAGPTEGRIAVYAVGLTLQRVLNECDFASTGKDRAAIAAKMDALKPEMAPIDAEIRAEMAKKKGMDTCPATPEHTAKMRNVMREFVDLGTDEFAAKLNGPSDGSKTTGEAAAKP